jgi:ubiquinone/menaquinone biosynthesis C-methylase UbiE
MSLDDYSFRAFSQHDFYRQVNEWLLDRTGLKRGWTVLDVACGCGAVTELIAERIRGGCDAVVIGLDMSASALREAREKLAGARDVVVEFVQARAEEMSQSVRRVVDAVVFCNGIHYVEDKSRLLAEVHRTLPAGGVFAFNTTFFQGAHLPETDRFYRRWMIKALRTLRGRYDLRPERDKVEARHQLTPEQYRTLLEIAPCWNPKDSRSRCRISFLSRSANRAGLISAGSQTSWPACCQRYRSRSRVKCSVRRCERHLPSSGSNQYRAIGSPLSRRDRRAGSEPAGAGDGAHTP